MRIYSRPPYSKLPSALHWFVGFVAMAMAAALSGCADSLPSSELPNRGQTAEPALDKDAQRKAMAALVKERGEREADIVRALESKPAKR